MGVPKTHFTQINFNGHVVICDVTTHASCDDVIKMAAVQSAQNDANVEMFVRYEGIEKKINKSAKLLKIVRSFGVGSTNSALIVRPVEKIYSKSKLVATACKALRKLLVLKNVFAKKQTEATESKSNNTMYVNLNNTANIKVRVDNTNKNLNDLLQDEQHSTAYPSIGEWTSVSEYETTIMTGAGLSDSESRSVLNSAFCQDRRTGMNQAFIESLKDSVYITDDTVVDLFNQCRYIDEDDNASAAEDDVDVYFGAVASEANDINDSMSDSSEDESIGELDMNIDDDYIDVDSHDESESLKVNASLVLSWVNSLNLGYHEQFNMTTTE